MACALTTGFTLDCRDSNGGIEAVYLATFSSTDTITAASGLVTAMSLSPSRVFYKYELRRYTAQSTENITGSQENGTVFYDQLVEINLDKLQATMRNEIALLAQNYLYVIVKDNNGKYWLYGKTRGLTLNTGNGATGTAVADRNGYNLQFSGQEPVPAFEVQASVIATIT